MTTTQFIELDVPVQRDADGGWCNPHIPDFGGYDDKRQEWVLQQRLELSVSCYGEMDDEFQHWNPPQPKGVGWHVIEIGETENGDCIWVWARRLPAFKKYLTITMPDGSVWGVPTEMIALNRATEYAHEFDDNIATSLAKDTIPLFEEDEYAIQDWAVCTMSWSDFKGHQVKLKDAPAPYFEDAWLSGETGFSDGPATS